MQAGVCAVGMAQQFDVAALFEDGSAFEGDDDRGAASDGSTHDGVQCASRAAVGDPRTPGEVVARTLVDA